VGYLLAEFTQLAQPDLHFLTQFGEIGTGGTPVMSSAPDRTYAGV
jgi:hypothetical protein